MDEENELAQPQFISGRSGTRMYTVAALIERVIDEFIAEYGEDSPAIREADTATKRLRLVLDVTEYTIAVESVRLSSEDKAHIVERVYSELFGYGPLDALILDPTVTTIAIKGFQHAAVRHGHGELISLGQIFDDEGHLRRVINRLLIDAGTELTDESGFVEVGLNLGDRRASISVIAPPISMQILADIRVHPAVSPTLDDLIANGFMSEEAASLVRLIVASKYGFTIAGEPETGKTILLNALAHLLPEPDQIVAVERASEMALPQGVKRIAPQWRLGDDPGATFGTQIFAAMQHKPACLLLDEVRADEPHTIAPLLDDDAPPRQIWNFRGAPDAKRLQSALGMLARRAAPGQGERLVHSLYEKMPFVLTVARIRERLQLFSIAEWQSRADSDYPDYVMLMRYQEGQARPTEARPARWLD